jgi:hypothetical protein
MNLLSKKAADIYMTEYEKNEIEEYDMIYYLVENK